MPGFDLEIIEPHDGTVVTAEGGLFPHIAIEVDDIDAAIADLKAAGITSFRNGVDKAADLPIFGGIRNAFFFGPNGEQLVKFFADPAALLYLFRESYFSGFPLSNLAHLRNRHAHVQKVSIRKP